MILSAGPRYTRVMSGREATLCQAAFGEKGPVFERKQATLLRQFERECSMTVFRYCSTIRVDNLNAV